MEKSFGHPFGGPKVVWANAGRDFMTILDHFGGHFGDLFWSKIDVGSEAVFGRGKSVRRDEKKINSKLDELENVLKFIGF